jgi:adhesin transport system outer membrane protein
MRRWIPFSGYAFQGYFAICCFVLAIPLPASTQAESITLSEALEEALARNPSISASEEYRLASEARVWEARSGYFPRFSIVAGYTRYQEPSIVIPIHEQGVFPPLDDQIYETSFQLKVPVFNGGRTAANTRAAGADAKESHAQKNFAEAQVMERIGQVFIQAWQMEDNQRLVTSRITSLRRRHREMSLLLGEGRVSPADMALVNASVESARADSIDIDSKRAELAYRLGRLLGVERPVQPETAGLDTNSADDGPEPFVTTDASEIAGPRLAMARAQLAKAEANKAAATSSFWPDVSAFAAYNYRSGADSDLIGEWMAGIALRIPLFEGGRRIANRNAASATVRAAEMRLAAAQQEQQTRLQIDLEQWRSAGVRREHIARAVENKAKSVVAQQEMYRAGRISLSDVLVQETELLQLSIQERTLAYAGMLALLSYHSAAGTLSADKVQKIVRSIP